MPKKVKPQTDLTPDTPPDTLIVSGWDAKTIPNAATYYIDVERFAHLFIQRIASHPAGSLRQHLQRFLDTNPDAITNDAMIGAMDEFISSPDV